MRSRRSIVALALASLLATAALDASAAGPNSTILISRPTGLGALPETGENSGVVGREAMSSDGRFVVFTSGADDLGVRDTAIHVWVRDTVSGTTSLVDRVPGGVAPGNGSAFAAAISRDGGTVCFLGTATNLVAGVTGTHVFAVTLATGAIVVADRANGAAGAVSNGTQFRCALDATGLRLAFDSTDDNLVPLDNNGVADVFVRHLALDATERVSVDSDEAEGLEAAEAPAINADGTRIAFETRAALDGADTNGGTDVYVRNTVAGTTVRASVGTGGVQGNGSSTDPAIDDAGTHVAFRSSATTLDLGGDGNGVSDIFWRDLGSDTTILVSRATGGAGALADGESFGAAISGDGLGVAFESLATNLGAGPPPAPGGWIYLRRLGTNVTSLLSRASGAAGAAADRSASGVSFGTAPTVATFGSRASNLDPDASGEFFQVFKRDLSTTTLVSRPSGTDPRGATVNESPPAGPRAISADGRFVVFASEADGLDPAAAGIVRHVFVRDTLEGTTTLVSRGAGAAGAPADNRSEGCAIAANGTHVAFVSRATNLLAGVTDAQVYVRDLTTGALEVASRSGAPSGAPSLDLDLDNEAIPDVSADGTRVVFVAGDRLVPADTNSRRDVYLRDLVAGTTTLVSVNAAGVAGDQDSQSPSMSDDGTRVAFSSEATDLLGSPVSGEHVYVRDLVAGTTVLADQLVGGGPGSGRAQFPELSGAGNRVAFFADDALTAELIPADGAVYVRDLASDTTLLASRADGPDGLAQSVSPSSESTPSLSHDGTRVGWAGGPLPTGAVTRVFLRDLAAGTTRLVSAVDGTADTTSNLLAAAPALSAGGGCVVFASRADNLTVPGYPTQDFTQIYLRVVEGECPVVSTTPTTTTTTLPPPGSGSPIAAKTIVMRPGRLVKLVAKGLPASLAAADPTAGGASLQMSGTTGGASFTLPASGWKAVGRRRPKGFKFEGGGCRVALLRRKLAVECRGDTGDLRLPEPGPLEVLLLVGGEAYCAECGGRTAGRPANVFKRKACPAPATCP